MNNQAQIFLLITKLTLKVPIKKAGEDCFEYFFIVSQRKQDFIIHVNPLLGGGFTWIIKSYFLQKVKVNTVNSRNLKVKGTL